MSKYSSPLLLERYEMKYLIYTEDIEDISDFVENYCNLDPYSELAPDHYYKITNLYLDSPFFSFYKNRIAGIDHRFNMRIRAYGDTPSPPYFYETKYKTHGIVKKRRAKVTESDWVENLQSCIVSNDSKTIFQKSDYQEQFMRLVHLYDARPKVLTQYRRKAYASFVDDYARVTFDQGLKYTPRSQFSFEVDDNELIHYDHPNNFYDDRNIILELKCTTRVPLWFQDLIRKFNLKRDSFSKYVFGVNEVIADRFISRFDRDLNFNF